MAPSDAQKRARGKWDRENMRVIGCKLKVKEAQAFKEYAAAKGKTSNALLKEYIYQCLKIETKEDGE